MLSGKNLFDTPAYAPLVASRTERVAIRGVKYQVRRWGEQSLDKAVPLVLLHGWMDVAASYQFVMDELGPAFAAARAVLAPDWRGFGGSQPAQALDHFVFADYYADLEALLHHYLGSDGEVDLVGHSMGGNIAMVYAALRPQRVRRLVNLEGFGLPDSHAAQAPQQLRHWLDGVRKVQRAQLRLRSYGSLQEVAKRLMQNNPRLPADKAQWLAGHWAALDAEGRWQLCGHPAHKVPSPQLYRADEMLAFYAEITSPVLAVEAGDDSIAARAQQVGKLAYSLADYHRRLQRVRNHKIAVVGEAGHMLHHDQPAAVADLITEFLG